MKMFIILWFSSRNNPIVIIFTESMSKIQQIPEDKDVNCFMI